MTVVKLIAAAKSIAIDQLEVTIREVRDQNTELQAHNTQLLLRARKAEDALKAYNIGLEPSGPPSFCGRQGGSCQCTSIDECIAK
jgi:hypothetical protein